MTSDAFEFDPVNSHDALVHGVHFIIKKGPVEPGSVCVFYRTWLIGPGEALEAAGFPKAP